ncbi:hypothetical protein [Azospirillum agricola]|uniref:hypothetical protein n=1 Tax=Azospirillum agricola TaxID=1720247 RepID=UPI001178C026|nr:hypothetical protein [Azospirillum agricola]
MADRRPAQAQRRPAGVLEVLIGGAPPPRRRACGGLASRRRLLNGSSIAYVSTCVKVPIDVGAISTAPTDRPTDRLAGPQRSLPLVGADGAQSLQVARRPSGARYRSSMSVSGIVKSDHSPALATGGQAAQLWRAALKLGSLSSYFL